MNARSIYTGIIVVCLLIISVGIYYILGGFDPIEVYFFEGTNRRVIGKEFFIPNDNATFQSKMESARSYIQDGTLKGKLTAVIYEDGWAERDSVHCFIGAAQDSVKGVLRLPAGYDYKQFETEKIYKIFITQNQWIRPVPSTIHEIMETKSIEEGEILQPFTFELYYQDGSFSVEKWVK